MFGIKTYLKKKLKNRLVPHYFPNKFPTQSLGNIGYHFLLAEIEKELKEYSKSVGLGGLILKPNKIAVTTWQKLAPYVANNLGNWSIKDEKPYNIATRLEEEVIAKMINLYNGENKNIEGYITSGATEGNIFSAWIGRKYLEQYTDKDKICLLRNDLTHYSIRKAADVVGVKEFVISLDEKSWSTSVVGLSKLVIQLYHKGLRGFIIPITFGYTVGGTNDDSEKIIKILDEIKSKYKDMYLFYWIDAALNGLILPFTGKNFRPFHYSEIQTFIVDFHKFAGVPYPAGLILYRQNLRKLIEKDIPYLSQKDNTLLGSRSGLSAAAIWTTIYSFGFAGFKKEVEKCIIRKNKFLENLKVNFPNIEIKTETSSIAAVLIVKKPLPLDICRKYGIELINYKITLKDSKKILRLYKLFFLPRF